MARIIKVSLSKQGGNPSVAVKFAMNMPKGAFMTWQENNDTTLSLDVSRDLVEEYTVICHANLGRR